MNDIDEFIAQVSSEVKRKDSYLLIDLLNKVSGYQPKLTGSIIGFGRYHYKYESGHEGDCCVIGFSPRKQHFAIYIMPGFEHIQAQLQKLGKHKLGKCCLYINKLADVDLKVLTEIAQYSLDYMQKNYECVEC